MVLTVSFVLAPETGFVVSVASAMRKHCHQLDISVGTSGPHDFAVRFRCRSSFRHFSVHRIPPNVRDDGQRPSFGRDGRSRRRDLPVGLSEIFLRAGLDSRLSVECVCEIGFLAKCHVRHMWTRARDKIDFNFALGERAMVRNCATEKPWCRLNVGRNGFRAHAKKRAPE